jgi:hypothetical protein
MRGPSPKALYQESGAYSAVSGVNHAAEWFRQLVQNKQAKQGDVWRWSAVECLAALATALGTREVVVKGEKGQPPCFRSSNEQMRNSCPHNSIWPLLSQSMPADSQTWQHHTSSLTFAATRLISPFVASWSHRRRPRHNSSSRCDSTRPWIN